MATTDTPSDDVKAQITAAFSTAVTTAMAAAGDDDDLRAYVYETAEDAMFATDGDGSLEAKVEAKAEAKAEAARLARLQAGEDDRAYRRERANRAARRRVRQEESAEAHGAREPLSILTGASLRDLEEPEPDHIVESVLAADSSLIVFSPPKTGKTVWVHDLCCSLTTGASVFGTQAVAPIPDGGQVVVIDTELPRANARRRMGEAQPNWDHLTLVSAENHLDQLDVTQPDVRRHWVETLRRLKVWVVVIDTLGPLVSDSGLDANTEGHRMVMAWKQTVHEAGGRGTIFVDHSNPNHTEVHGPRGDSQKVNYAGGYLHLRPAGEFTLDDGLPTEYVISGHTRAGDLYLDLTRDGAHFRANQAGVSRTRVDPVARDAYDYGPRVLQYAEDLRAEQAEANEKRDPYDTSNYPSEKALVTRCHVRLGEQTKYGRPRWTKIVDYLMSLGALEDLHPTGTQTRLAPNTDRPIPDPSATTVVGSHGPQGTPVDLTGVSDRVFGPQPVPAAPDDGDPEDVTDTPDDTPDDTPRPSLSVVRDTPDDTPAEDTP